MMPKFTGFIQRLVETGIIRPEHMTDALETAKKNQQDIVEYLVQNHHLSSRIIAQTIASELGEPFFDLSVYNINLLVKTHIDEKIITQYHILPIFKRHNVLFIATANPTNLNALEAVRLNSKMHVEAIVVEFDKLNKLIEQHYHAQGHYDFDHHNFELESAANPSESNHLDDEIAEDESPIVKYINKLLIDAIRMGASDLHFEPYENIYRVRYRIDGILRQIASPPLQVANRLASRLKVMSQMDISEKRIPQDGRIKLKLSAKKAIDFRVNSLPTLFGEKLVLRILDSSNAMLGIDALGYEPKQKALFMQALEQAQGMLLITGPTGSGKTVSLYTGLNILNTESANISTVEDPVEINLEGINQVNVNPKVGLSFASVLKAFLRQDPDIVMVGEIRDLETAEIAIKAAQTGHMVMSTLHTNSAPETLTRLRNMGVPSFNIATSINLIIAQRLARQLCPHCKTLVHLPKSSLLEMGFKHTDFQHNTMQIYQPCGCSECREGYKGRIGIYEVMQITPEISQLIMQDADALQIAQAAQQAGFNNLRRSGLIKVMQGLTSLQEINRVTNI